ncbi:MAG: response regulator, partial [Lachnospiraceae bacterium]|nr:response regulator [Lachnospiraceae bacterium]
MRDGKNVILVIEDDPKLMESICIFMERNDYTVLCAESGEESLKLFFSANHEIDLILLDIMLPGIDGFQVLKAVREYSKVPLIIITSQDSDEAQLKGLTGGADNYI